MSTVAGVKDSTSFVGAAQLHRREPDFGPSTLLARFVRESFGGDFMLLDGLDNGQFLAQQRGEVGRFALGYGRFRRRV